MDRIVVDNRDAETLARLSARAARNGRSIEDEARDILKKARGGVSARRDLSAAFRACIKPEARANSPLPPRDPIPDPPSFDETPPT